MQFLNPNLAQSAKQIYDDCGTTLSSYNAKQDEHELEFFVDELIKTICQDLEQAGAEGVSETLIQMGYIKLE